MVGDHCHLPHNDRVPESLEEVQGAWKELLIILRQRHSHNSVVYVTMAWKWRVWRIAIRLSSANLSHANRCREVDRLDTAFSSPFGNFAHLFPTIRGFRVNGGARLANK